MSEFWTTDDGLPQHTVTSLAQTPEGYLWVGTSGGLSRFDGIQFTIFDREATPALSSNRVTALATDHHGQLWVGTENGLARVDGPRSVFSVVEGLEGLSIRTLLVAPDTSVWAGTDKGLVRIHRSRVRRYTDGLPSLSIRTLAADNEDRLWIGTDRGLARLEAAGVDIIPSAYAGPITALFVDSDNTLWMGTDDDGLISYRVSEESIAGKRELTAPDISALHPDRDGALWIGTGDGLLRLRHGGPLGENKSVHRHSRDRILTLFVDREDIVWVGTDRGLTRLKRPIFRIITKADGMPSDTSLAILQTRDGAMWFGSNCRGLSRLRDGRVANFNPSDGLANSCVSSLHEGRDGSLWIGTAEGLSRRTNRDFTNYPIQTGLPNDAVLALHEDDRGAVWVGTRRSGLRRLAEGRVVEEQDIMLADRWVRAIFRDQHGRTWFGTAGGLSLLKDGVVTTFTTADGLPSNDIRALYEDADSVLWIGTFDGGLIRYAGGPFHSFSTREGLSDNRVTVILEDGNNFLWTCGNRGIQRIDKRLLDRPDDEVGSRSVLFGKRDGLKSTECSGGFQPPGWRSNDGRLWFPTLQGVAVVDPDSVFATTVPSSILIEDVLANGTSVLFGERADAPRGLRNIEIRYTSPTLSAPERTRFRFMMEGQDEAWVYANTQRSAYYRDMKPGSYVFKVSVSQDGLDWVDMPAALRLYVPHFFYETSWFFALCGILLVAAGVIAYRVNTYRLRVRADALERLVAERTEALHLEKLRAEAALEEAEEQHELARNALSVVEEQAIQLQEMDHIKSRFFGNISHEFRTPLTLIMSPIDHALRGTYGSLQDDFRDQLRVASGNARRLLRLVNQLLDLTRIDAGSLALRARRQDLVVFVREIVELFSSEAKRLQIGLYFAAGDESVDAYVDHDHFEKILFNLLANALRATPAGGKILVSLRASDDQHAEIVVRDTGIGIPPEKLPHVFDRFYQVDRPSATHAGTGIGLSLVKELIELHKGAIDVDSVPGFGTVFTIRLPLGRGHLAPHEVRENGEPGGDSSSDTSGILRITDKRDVTDILDAAPVESSQPTTDHRASGLDSSDGRSTVLVVEDNPEMRALIRRHLESAYRVIEAHHGLEGIRQARQHRPDLVVSDVVMPEMEGIAFCRLLKQDRELCDVPVILLTALASEESRLEGFQVGADDYLVKPFSDVELLTRVDNLIRTRRTMRERFSEEVVLRPTNVVVSSAQAAFLERVRNAVEEHMEDPQFGVRMLAAEVGVSESQLKRRVREAVGMAPVELIREMRLERAAQLLRQRAGNVGEIAFAVGFQNLPYFAKCFREHFGVQPSRYVGEDSGGVQPPGEPIAS